MRNRPVLDVSSLPTYGFGHRSILWWATMGLVLIESTMFGLLIAMYFYLRLQVPDWPPNLPPPDLAFGTANTLILLASCVPNHFVNSAAHKLDVNGVRLHLCVCLLFALAFVVVRVFEFRTLNCWWDTNAYGSIVWALLGFHTAHLATDLLDTGVLAVLMFTGPLDESRFVDVSENAVYGYFVVVVWLPIYAVLYFVPRWL